MNGTGLSMRECRATFFGMSTWRGPKDPTPDPEDRKTMGFMTPEYTIWCGGCIQWERFQGDKQEASRAAKNEGWKKSGLRGWMCPSCHGKGRSLIPPEEN